MATYHAISAISQAIVSLLKSARPASEFPNIDVRLFQAKDVQSSGDFEGISLFLYRVPVSGARRQMPLTIGPTGRPFRPPLPVDLFYAHFPDVRPFRNDETVDLIHDPISMQDINNIWEILGKHNVQVSATYVARVIPLDSRIETGVDAGPVQTRVFNAGQKDVS